MIARFSKYDFWIPEQILDFNKKNPEINILFSKSKIFSEDLEKLFFQIFFENQKFSLKINTIFFKKSKTSKISRISLDFFEIFAEPKFLKKYFDDKNLIFFYETFF